MAVRHAPLVLLLVAGCAGAPDTPTSVPTTAESRAAILAGDYALTAFVLTLVATGVAHLMALVTPRPRMFFS